MAARADCLTGRQARGAATATHSGLRRPRLGPFPGRSGTAYRMLNRRIRTGVEPPDPG